MNLTSFALADADLTPMQIDCIDQKAPSQEGASVGQNHTIFYNDEFKTDWSNWSGLMPGVGQLSRELASQGTQLLFVPAPTRPLLSPDLLNPAIKVQGDYLKSGASTEYVAFLRAAQNAGVNIVDLVPPLRSAPKVLNSQIPNYFLRDFHWTQAGSAIAARAIAQAANAKFGNLSFTDYLLGADRFTALENLKQIKRACGIKEEGNLSDRFVTLQTSDLAVIPQNIGSLEQDGTLQWRWFSGPGASFKLVSNAARTVTLDLTFVSPVDKQSLTVRLNGAPVYTAANVKKDASTSKRLRFAIKAGTSMVTLNYGLWNHRRDTRAFSNDNRDLALRFDELTFSAPKSGETAFISPDPYPHVATGDLLDDNMPLVVLAGSSYSDTDLNLAGFLRRELRSDVLNVSTIGGGAYSSIRDYLSSGFQDSHPKLLIWEAPLLFPAGNNPADIRELQGMVNGPCIESKALVWKPGTIGPDATVNLPLVSDQVTYLYVKLNGATSQKIQVDELTGGNLTTRYTIDHGDRSQNRTQFWLRLPPGKATSFNISIPPQAGAPTTQADIAICKSL
ncbi:alginate O-acetyltransferase AlgX-related protein [Deinococcus altitudinis]|uniref:alginate O-acetyltransferase AlgX-related protein n=1 Tax=Deinococcus altitudinis TaxID=468914 RepID=UPI003892166B